jgi:hypothetical protein
LDDKRDDQRDSSSECEPDGIFSAIALGQLQTSIIPQIANGRPWQTTIVITNTLSSGASASLSFYKETSGGAAQSWNLTFLEGPTQRYLTRRSIRT